jgi:hypothetical protein
MRARLSFVALLAGLALAGSVLAGCGGTDGSGDGFGSSTPDSSATGGPMVSGSASSSPSVNDPAATGKNPGGVMTITGTPTEGVENGCIVMQSGDTLYLLIGAEPGALMTGRPVVVRGTPEPGLMTTCQQGTPFRVTEVRPA